MKPGKKRKPPGEWLIQGYIFLSPFYLFKSGIPQISDYLMMFTIGLVLALSEFKIPYNPYRETRSFGLFALWTLFVNLVWIFKHQDPAVLQHSLFYLYNYLVYLTVKIMAFQDPSITRVIHQTIGYTLLFQAVAALFVVDFSGFRHTVFFNNPNQLGYFALISLTIFLSGSRSEAVKPWLLILAQLSGIFLVALSLSSAAMLATFLLYLYHYVGHIRKYWKWILGAALIPALLTLLPLSSPLIQGVLTNVQIRITTIGMSQDDNLAGRGYDRIAHHPEYLFLGAGEGVNTRFESRLNDELHSSWGTLLFSYGIIGIILFGMGVYSIKHNSRPDLFCYLAPTFFYGLTHQGLRFTHLWFLFVFLDIANRPRGEQEEQPAQSLPGSVQRQFGFDVPYASFAGSTGGG